MVIRVRLLIEKILTDIKKAQIVQHEQRTNIEI